MKKKIVIIILMILIIIASIGTGGYYIYIKYKQQDPFELEWVTIYYNYMKKSNEESKKKQETLKYYREDEMIEFCKIENIEKPIMLFTYKELGQNFTDVLYIDENNEVNILKPISKYSKVEYLYDIEEKSYDYYIHETNDNEQKYSKISENIKIKSEQENIEQDLTGYIVKEGEIISVTTLEGKKLEISKYDKKFIKTNLVENRWTAINLNTYEEEIKKKLSNALKEMKKELTEKEMEKVSEKEIEIQTTKQEMVKAIEEIEQKQKEEEERKKAEEEARIKAEEEAKKKAEEEAKKAEEEAKKIAEEKKRQEESQARKLHIKIWNI